MSDKAGNAIDQMATAATTLRDAIAAALPVSPTQLMTVQVPGTIITPKDYLWDPKTTPFIPLDKRIAEARLVDSQVPISKVMMGRTGKSVARSYLTALDGLISVEASISSALAGNKPLDDRQQMIRNRYQNSMTYLTSVEPGSNKSRLSIYVEKQDAWNKAVEIYNEAQILQQKLDQTNKLSVDAQRASFLQWMQTHGRDYKATIQAKYMDWVVHGFKFDIEFNFGVVDVSSAMKRVESSKEAFRNLTLLAADGASEYASVNLTPSDWATKIDTTVALWASTNKTPSPLEIRAEIKRLKNVKISHQALLESVEAGTFIPKLYSQAASDGDETLKQSYKTSYDEVNTQNKSNDADKTNAAGVKKGVDYVTIFATKEAGTNSAYKSWNDNKIKQNNAVVIAQGDAGKKETVSYLNGRISTVEAEIKDLELRLQTISPDAKPANQAVAPEVINHDGSVIDASEIIASKDLKHDVPANAEVSPWTRITAKVSQSQSESTKISSESLSSAEASYGSWWGASASGSTSSSSANASSTTKNLDVEISMDCLLVEIERPWLHAELFADYELDAAPGFKISPGPSALQRAAAEHTPVEADYTQFCSYPTAFVVACNVELGFNGDTSHLESQLEASSIEANVSVGWGPFSVSASHKSSKSSSRTKAESTATGMHISLQAPQIIAWVSELLPALPKPVGANPLLLGLPLAKPANAPAPGPTPAPGTTPAPGKSGSGTGGAAGGAAGGAGGGAAPPAN